MLDLEGTPVLVVDTAGIRPPKGDVETEGVLRAEKLIEEADLLLAVFDSSQPLDEDDCRLLALTAQRERVVVLNKWDLSAKCLRPDDGVIWNGSPAVAVSALCGDGIEQLRQVLAEAIRGQTDALLEGVAVNLRHYGLLRAIEEALEGAKRSVEEELPLDQIACDLREASQRLGEITGEVFSEEIINRIFSSFCLGK
jgi:tRNA modification GTPase